MEEKAGFVGQVAGCIGQVIGALVALAVLVWVGGITRTEVTYVPTITKQSENQTSFEEKLNARHWVAGFVKGKQPDVNTVLSKHMKEGDQLIHLTILTKHSWADMLISGITFGVYTPVTVIVRGTVGKKEEFARRQAKPKK